MCQSEPRPLGSGWVHNMQATIENLFDNKPAAYTAADRELFTQFLAALNAGHIRAAEPDPAAATGWRVNPWVKKGILLGFRMGVNIDMSVGTLSFCDKDTYPMQRIGPEKNIRIVPGGSSVREGAYLGQNVTCMPPMYINVGAYVGDGTMGDSHALVGSCAHQGVRIHHGAVTDVSADVDVHGRHAGDVLAEVCAFADAAAAGHDADVLLRADALHRISVLVAEAESAHGHVDIDAHAEADQNALLDPDVDAPAGGRRWVRLGGADAALGQRDDEGGKEDLVFR